MKRCIVCPDKFGYYTVGDRKTFSKIEALEWQQHSGLWPHWNFNQDTFQSIDWTQEPCLDLWTLYRARARQIRESYDYCVLFYSGGSDSHNLLTAWIDEGCHIDEVATFHYIGGGKNTQSFMNAEVVNAAIPIVQSLQQKINFKHRLIDISQDVNDLIQIYSDDFKYLMTKHMSPNNHAKIFWRDRIEEWSTLISQGKKLCFVWGSDKPQIFYDDKFYVQFFDIVDNCVGPHSQLNWHRGYFDELFYWTPDMPEIIVKQAHKVMTFCKHIHEPTFYQPQPSPFGYNPRLKQYVTANTIKLILYPKWDPATFCDGKTASTLWSDRDTWFIHGNTTESRVYREMSISAMRQIHGYWLNDCNDFSKGIKSHASPRYYLE